MDTDERFSMLEESRMASDLQLCESCINYHPHYDLVQNTEGEFICPECVAKYTCDECGNADPTTSIIHEDGEPTRMCDGCYEKMIS